MINNAIEQIDDILEPQDWSFPVPIAYGPGRLSEISAQCTGMGIQNPLIVTDKGSAHLPFIKQLQDLLSRANLTQSTRKRHPRWPRQIPQRKS
jgi:alcohol dehydrogenase class IV